MAKNKGKGQIQGSPLRCTINLLTLAETMLLQLFRLILEG